MFRVCTRVAYHNVRLKIVREYCTLFLYRRVNDTLLAIILKANKNVIIEAFMSQLE